MKIMTDQALLFCRRVFEAVGLSTEDARIAADIIVDANLHGVHSHGISRLPVYMKRISEGRINPTANIRVVKHDAVVLVDGDNGLGQVVTYKAVREALKFLSDTGTLSVAIRNSNHFGHAFYYCQQVAMQGAFCMMTTNSPKGIPPWGGREAYFGTNPIAFGFPTRTDPVIVDMSSSIVARGNIILAAQNHETIPEGWAMNSAGKPTTDPQEALKGAVLPFGGAKGYALALSLEILAGILTGANFGSHVQSIYNDEDDKANVGHFMFLSQTTRYMDKEAYFDRMEQMIEEIKNIPLAEGFDSISIPGERKRQKAEHIQVHGIQLTDEILLELNAVAKQVGVQPPVTVE